MNCMLCLSRVMHTEGATIRDRSREAVAAVDERVESVSPSTPSFDGDKAAPRSLPATPIHTSSTTAVQLWSACAARAVDIVRRLVSIAQRHLPTFTAVVASVVGDVSMVVSGMYVLHTLLVTGHRALDMPSRHRMTRLALAVLRVHVGQECVSLVTMWLLLGLVESTVYNGGVREGADDGIYEVRFIASLVCSNDTLHSVLIIC
jgi:hypothetical protein